MTPRPFYRSRLFWLGLPGLVFLLWAWWDSGGNYSGFTWSRPTRIVEVDVAVGRLYLASTRDLPPGHSPRPNKWSMRRELLEHDEGNLLTSKKRRFTYEPVLELITYSSADKWEGGVDPFDSPISETRGAIVALWLLPLSYLAVWLAALAIWQRRKSRLLKLHTAP